MPGEQKSIWLSTLVAAAATIVILAGSAAAFVKWGMPKAERYLNDKFAAVDTKIEMSSRSALSTLTGLPSLAKTAKEIETLNAKIKKTNDTLDSIQKQMSLATMKAELAPLNGKLDKTTTALSAIQSELARAKPENATGNAALARIEKTVNTLKDEIAGAASQARSQDAAAKLDAVQASLGKLQDTVAKLDDVRTALAKIEKAADTLKSDGAANASVLTDTQTSLAQLRTAVKDGFAGAAAARAALKDEVAKLAQPAAPPTTGSAKTAGEDVVMVYVSAPAAQPAQPLRPGSIPPMNVLFAKVGSTDDNGQTALIIRKLRPILKKHEGCSIAVAGHADTLGSDDVNHALSKRRAKKIAAKLKAAFAGQGIPVTNTAWGERKLKEWTDDETPDATNRRVDVVVRCSGASG